MPQSIRIDRRFAAALLAASLLQGCERKAEPPPSPAPAAPPATVAPTPPLPPPPLGREEVLDALEAARAAYATGEVDAAQPLAGRRFAVRQAFGCGPTPAAQARDGVARWGPKGETVEISLRPVDWTGAPLTGEDSPWEAVEGFWLTRPWIKGGGCPVRRAEAPAVDPATAPVAPKAASPAPTPVKRAKAPAGEPTAAPAASTPASPAPAQTDGLAAVFERGGSRLGRRAGSPLSFTLRNEAEPGPQGAGYRLVIEGRFTAFADGNAVRCRADSPDDRPVCIAAAEVDRVAFETADGKLLKEWRPG